MLGVAQVLAAAQTQFGCTADSLKGAALENEGGTGTVGSHWEQRLFPHEIMVGASSTSAGAMFSNLTLALCEDSGSSLYEVRALSIARQSS
ncbi:hypothetical protein CYMTET_24760 [Cymbomonas tetramitiformis]|uniref:Uncharacterized protein n=1 Tax=Cymbomonas tetramitiformis TaxID=36881 RepID=A0AAE0FV42_9CHLO|nr:hypothetical protein CYMTET_24760 [Cymbomonas tetramitiformis]